MTTSDFTGTVSLTKLALRRDRVKLPAWVLGLSIFLWIATGVNAEFSAEEMLAIVALATDNPAMRMLVSPIMAESITEISRFVFFRFSFVYAILVSLMSIHAVTRHTRRNEETGCAEMVGSLVTGRYAETASAIAVGVVANVVLAFLMGLALIAHGLPVSGSFASGASFGGLGIAFTGVAAVAAQLSGTTSGANGIGGLSFGAAFAVNAIANATGPVNPGGLGFQSSGLAWLTPMGWTQRFYPFDEANWWLLALFLALAAALSLCALFLVDRRDVGRGVLADRAGRSQAPRWMLTPFGVAWRLQRGSLLSWAVPMAFMGVMVGASAESLGETMGGTEAFRGAFSDAIAQFRFLVLGIAATAAAIYVIRALLRMRSEEDGGPLENVLSTPVRRSWYMASHAFCAILGGVALMAVFAVSQALAMEGTAADLGELLLAGLFQSVGMLVLAGFVMAAFGIIPRAVGPISLAAILLAGMVGPFFGVALNLPDWMMNVSPFTHIAYMPAEVSAAAVVILLAVTTAFAGIGFASFARRDLKTR